MIIVCCPQCRLALRVIGELLEVASLVGEQSEFWPDKYVCPRCEYKSAVGSVEKALSSEALVGYELRDLSTNELFAALNGLGLPDEGSCRLAKINELLKEKPVRKIEGFDIPGTDRCVLCRLVLWDGTRLYFGAGPEGAVIYRNVPPQSYAEKIP